MNADIQTLRTDLAAAFRLAAHFGFHEGICNHFSARVPGEEERYLINPYGLYWAEIQADSLILVDADRRVIEGTGEVEATAFYIHRASHRANPRHVAVLHTHMPYATALTMVEGGRLEMAHQTAIRFHDRTAYLPTFGGLALDASEGDRIAGVARDNGTADVFFLGHHGVVCGAPTVAQAFCDLYYLERACRQQILAQSTGLPLKLIPDEVVARTAQQFRQETAWQDPVTFTAWKRALVS